MMDEATLKIIEVYQERIDSLEKLVVLLLFMFLIFVAIHNLFNK